VSAAIISGTFAALVAVVAAVLSYVFGKRTMERQLADNITQIGATGEQERITAQREYQLDAMKTFRATVGGPKGQVIESAHDLSDRLRKLVGRDSAASGVSTDPWGLMRGQNGFYRRNTAWLILHPFIWIDVLRGKLVFLDQTLGELVEDEFRFLNFCRLLERAVTERTLFEGTDYEYGEIAHVWYNQLRFLAEQLTVTGEAGVVAISYSEFMKRRPSPEVQAVMAFLEAAAGTDKIGEFGRARLIALYAASNLFLENFGLPYRQFEGAEQSLVYLESISPERGQPIRENLLRLLREHADLAPFANRVA
jgi:hypothetical protein